MKRSCNITFYDERSSPSGFISITQEYFGLDIQDSDKSNIIHVKTEINGNIPSIDMDAKVHFRDLKQEYKHSRIGIN